MLGMLVLVGLFVGCGIVGMILYCIWNTFSGDESMFRD